MPGDRLNAVKYEPPPSESDDEEISSHLNLHSYDEQGWSAVEELAGTPAAPAATPVCVKQEPAPAPAATTLELETLEPAQKTPSESSAPLPPRSLLSSELHTEEFTPLQVKDEPLSEGEPQLSGEDTSDSCGLEAGRSPKSWTAADMEGALDALRTQNMSLTKASTTFGIPSTTLWQRAHRLGIDTPKKEGASKSWSEEDLKAALQALRAGAISANKASKAYGIPSSTLYKIARREGIRLAAPFNAAPTAWRRADLRRALLDIRAGRSSVQRAAAAYGIPTGTLYGRCKREGIELSRSNPTPWSEDAMGEALEAVRVGQMSINQAAIHYNLPYSSLYGRFKRCKYPQQEQQCTSNTTQEPQETEQQDYQYSQYHQQNIPAPSHGQSVHYQQTHDPSMLSNVMMHEPVYGEPAMYYSQHSAAITTS